MRVEQQRTPYGQHVLPFILEHLLNVFHVKRVHKMLYKIPAKIQNVSGFSNHFNHQ